MTPVVWDGLSFPGSRSALYLGFGANAVQLGFKWLPRRVYVTPVQGNAWGLGRCEELGRSNGPTIHRQFGERLARWADSACGGSYPQGDALDWANARAFGPTVAQLICAGAREMGF